MKTLEEWQELAKQGKLRVRVVNQRGQLVRVKIRSVSSQQEDGSLMCWTSVTPVLCKPSCIEVV